MDRQAQFLEFHPTHGPEVYQENLGEAIINTPPFDDSSPPLAIQRDPDTFKEALYPSPPNEIPTPVQQKPLLRNPVFWTLFAGVLLLVTGAVTGGILGTQKSRLGRVSSPSGVSAYSGTSTSSSTITPTATSTGIVNAARKDTAIKALDWGSGSNYEARIYFQDEGGWIYESAYSAGKWERSPRKLLKAKVGTPIAGIFYPYGGSTITKNVLISTFVLSDNNTILEYTFNGITWGPGLLGTTLIRTTAPDSQLSSVLLRQPQPANKGLHTWEPSVLYYQDQLYRIKEVVGTYNYTEPIWVDGSGFPDYVAYGGTPIAAAAVDNGYGIEVFYLAPDKTLVYSKAAGKTWGSHPNVFRWDDAIQRAWNITAKVGTFTFGLPTTPFLNDPNNVTSTHFTCDSLAAYVPAFYNSPDMNNTNDEFPESAISLSCINSTTRSISKYIYGIPIGYYGTDKPGYIYSTTSKVEYTWYGPDTIVIGDGSRGPRPLSNLMNVADLYNNGTSGVANCREGYVYQDEKGLLNLWGSSCNGTYQVPSGSIHPLDVPLGYIGAVIPTWVNAF